MDCCGCRRQTHVNTEHNNGDLAAPSVLEPAEASTTAGDSDVRGGQVLVPVARRRLRPEGALALAGGEGFY